MVYKCLLMGRYRSAWELCTAPFEGGDDLADLAPQTDGVALRNEDHAVEGVCDDEDREVACTELHVRDELGEDRTLVIKTEDCTLGKTAKSSGR